MGGAPHAGLGSEMFISASSLTSSGTIMAPQGTAHAEEDIENDDGDNASPSSSVSSIVVALATATLADPSWQFSPSYPPQYLSTIGEYLPPPKQPRTMSTAGAAADDGDTQKGHPWATEKYENSMRTDHVFDRFVERAAHEPQQCVR
jgi:pre-rRNA-processing protein TSR4